MLHSGRQPGLHLTGAACASVAKMAVMRTATVAEQAVTACVFSDRVDWQPHRRWDDTADILPTVLSCLCRAMSVFSEKFSVVTAPFSETATCASRQVRFQAFIEELPAMV